MTEDDRDGNMLNSDYFVDREYHFSIKALPYMNNSREALSYDADFDIFQRFLVHY